jgi:hypothetical protein
MAFVGETLMVDGGTSGNAQITVSGDRDGATANGNVVGHGYGYDADGMILARAEVRLGSRSTGTQSAEEAVALPPVRTSLLRNRALDTSQSNSQDHKIHAEWRDDWMELHTMERECIGPSTSTVMCARRRSGIDSVSRPCRPGMGMLNDVHQTCRSGGKTGGLICRYLLHKDLTLAFV